MSRLPRSSDLLVPVSESPNENISLAERFRPSAEQCAAQKGVERAEALATVAAVIIYSRSKTSQRLSLLPLFDRGHNPLPFEGLMRPVMGAISFIGLIKALERPSFPWQNEETQQSLCQC